MSGLVCMYAYLGYVHVHVHVHACKRSEASFLTESDSSGYH